MMFRSKSVREQPTNSATGAATGGGGDTNPFGGPPSPGAAAGTNPFDDDAGEGQQQQQQHQQPPRRRRSLGASLSATSASASSGLDTGASALGNQSDLTLNADDIIRPLPPSARDIARDGHVAGHLRGSATNRHRPSAASSARQLYDTRPHRPSAASNARQLYDELSASQNTRSSYTGSDRGDGFDGYGGDDGDPYFADRRVGHSYAPPRESTEYSGSGGGGKRVSLAQKLGGGGAGGPNGTSRGNGGGGGSAISGGSGHSGARRSQGSRRLGSIRATLRAESDRLVDVDAVTEQMESQFLQSHRPAAAGDNGDDADDDAADKRKIEVGDGVVGSGGDPYDHRGRRRRPDDSKAMSRQSSSSRRAEHTGTTHTGADVGGRRSGSGSGRDSSGRPVLPRNGSTKEQVRKSKLQKIAELQTETRDLKKSNRELRRELTALERKHLNALEENRLHLGVLEGRLRTAGLRDDMSSFTGGGDSAIGDLGMVFTMSSSPKGPHSKRRDSLGTDTGSRQSSYSSIVDTETAASRADAMRALSEAAYKNKITLSITRQKLSRVETQLETTYSRCEELEEDKAEKEYELSRSKVEVDRLKEQLAKVADAGGSGAAAAAAASAAVARQKSSDDRALEELRGRNSLLKEEWERSEERAASLAEKLGVKDKEVEETRREMENQSTKMVELELKVKELEQQHKEEEEQRAKEKEASSFSSAGEAPAASARASQFNVTAPTEEESAVGSATGPMAAIAALQEELQNVREARERDRERSEELLEQARQEAASDAAQQISKNAMRESERRDELRREADEALTEVDQLREDLELAKRDIAVEQEVAKESSARLDESVAEVAKIGGELSSSKDELLEVRNMFANAERKHRSDMNEAEMIFRDSARELEDAKVEVQRLEDDLERTREDLTRAEADIIKIKAAEEESGSAEAGRVQHEIVKNELSRAKEEVERLQREKSVAEANADASMRDARSEADREVAKMSEDLTVALADLGNTKQELERTNEKLAELEKKNEEGAGAAGDVKRLTAELEELQDTLSAKEREVERLQSNIESAKEEVDNMWDRCDRLEEDNRALEDEIEDLTKRHDQELDELRGQASNARRELERKTKNVEVMGKQIQSLQDELDRAKSRVEVLEREVTNLKSNPPAVDTFYGADDAMSVSARSGAEPTVGGTSQADMLANAAAAAQAKGRGRRFGSRLFRGVPQTDAEGNLTPEGQLAEKNMRIAQLESELDDNADAIKKLESEIVLVRTSYKDEEYHSKKKIESLQKENTAHVVKIALLEDKLFKARGSVGENEGLAAMGESEAPPPIDEAKEGSTVQLDAAYVGKLRNEVDKGKEKIEEMEKTAEHQALAYTEMESRLRKEITSLEEERAKLEASLSSQQELFAQERLSDVEDLQNKLEARDQTLSSLKSTLGELKEKENLLKCKEEHIDKLKKEVDVLSGQLSLMVRSDMDVDVNGEDAEEQQRRASVTAGDAVASAAAFNLM